MASSRDMVNPGHYVAEKRSSKERLHVGSNALYQLTDIIRHYIRMIDLESGGTISNGPTWNNLIVLG